jgi:hypothetical protein
MAVVVSPLVLSLAGADRFAIAAEEPKPPAGASPPIDTLHVPGGTIQSDRTGKGAVLCVWMIYAEVQATGQTCFKGQDQAFQAELDSSIKRIDAFIIKNSSRPVTQAGLDARKAQGRQQLGAIKNLCTSGAAQMYQALRAGGPDKLRASTTDLLSIPREPVTNPCL